MRGYRGALATGGAVARAGHLYAVGQPRGYSIEALDDASFARFPDRQYRPRQDAGGRFLAVPRYDDLFLRVAISPRERGRCTR